MESICDFFDILIHGYFCYTSYTDLRFFLIICETWMVLFHLNCFVEENFGNVRRRPNDFIYEWQQDTTKYSITVRSTHLVVQYSTVQYSTVQYSTVQYSTVQYSTVQYCTVQYSTVQYSTVQYTTVLTCFSMFLIEVIYEGEVIHRILHIEKQKIYYRQKCNLLWLMTHVAY